MRILSRNDYRRMPWKNGGGFTTQLAAWPEDAGLAGFEWRISTAEVASPGPFSLFAGCERSLAVLHGAGVALRFDELHTTLLTPHNEPLRFDGERQVHASLLDGPVTDFNVISRRDRWNHTLERLPLHGRMQCARDAQCMFIYCAAGDAVQLRLSSGRTATCAQGDAVMLDEGDSDHIELSCATPSLLYLTRLTAKENRHAE